MIKTVLLASVFTPAQTAGCVIVAFVLMALIALNIVLLVLYNRRGERKLYDRLLQRQRELLMKQLEQMRSGGNMEREKTAEVFSSIRAAREQEEFNYREERAKKVAELKAVQAASVSSVKKAATAPIMAEVAHTATEEPVPERVEEPVVEERTEEPAPPKKHDTAAKKTDEQPEEIVFIEPESHEETVESALSGVGVPLVVEEESRPKRTRKTK